MYNIYTSKTCHICGVVQTNNGNCSQPSPHHVRNNEIKLKSTIAGDPPTLATYSLSFKPAELPTIIAKKPMKLSDNFYR